MIKRNILLSVVLSLIIIVTFSNIQAVDKKTESKKYPDKPEEVVVTFVDHMHKGEYDEGTKYFHPDYFVKGEEWKKIIKAKPSDYFYGTTRYDEVEGFEFKDDKLVNLTPRKHHIISLIHFTRLWSEPLMLYGIPENIIVVSNDGKTAIVTFDVDKTKFVLTYTETLTMIDGKWKISADENNTREVLKDFKSKK